MEDQDFRAAIVADPADDDPRLVYADWLEEQNDPHGEFIRIQCELAKLDLTDISRWDLTDREAELLNQHETKWLSGLNKLPSKYEIFDRGFVNEVCCDAETFADIAEDVFQTEPITSFHLKDLTSNNDNAIETLASCRALSQIRELTLYDLHLTNHQWQQLADSPHLTAIELIVDSFKARSLTTAAIGQSQHLRDRLRNLYLTFDTGNGPAYFNGEWPELEELHVHFEKGCLAPAISTPRLRRLNIGTQSRWNKKYAALDSTGVTELTIAANPNFISGFLAAADATGCLSNVRSFDLGYCELKADVIARLCSNDNLQAAHSIRLYGGGLSSDATRRLANHLTSGQLRKLDITDFEVDWEAARELATSPGMAGLHQFSLYEQVDPSNLMLFKNSVFRSTIRELSLPIKTAATALRLFADPWPDLHTLDLRGCRMKDSDLQTLLEFGSLPSLRELKLHWTGLGPLSLRSIAMSVYAPNLRRLGFEGNAATNKSVRTILNACPKLNDLDLHGCTGLNTPVADDLKRRVHWPDQ